MGTSIDAKIRITAETAKAVAALRELKKESEAVQKSATPPGGQSAIGVIGDDAAKAAVNTNAAAKSTRDLRLEAKAAAAEAATQAAAAKAQAKAQKDAADQLAKAQRQQANQARQLGPQITDIVTGLATGQSPLTVLLQQGGQLKDVFGGVGNAGKALLSVVSPLRIGIGGLVGVFSLLAVEVFKGHQESAELNRTLALTGNLAGTTQGQITAIARSIAQQQNVSIADVRETLAGLVASGGYTSSTLASTAKAVTALRKITGQNAADSIKEFQGQSQGVAEWAAKQNLAYNFLTAKEHEHIQSLEAQGRVQEAMRIANDALSSTLQQRAAPAIGTIERSWNAVSKALSDVLDRMRDIGRDSTPEKAIEQLTTKLDYLEQKRDRLLAGGNAPSKSLEAAIKAIRAQVALETEQHNRDLARQAERAITVQNEQDLILRNSKSFQDGLAQLNVAGLQQRLAQRLAELDREQSAVERSNDQGLLSAKQYALALNAIDQQRLQAQRQVLEQTLKVEEGKKVTKPEDIVARDTAIRQFKAQIEAVRSQLAQTQSKAVGIESAAALADARDLSSQWQQVWQQAFQQVRQLAQTNAATRAVLITDPIERANAEAQAKMAASKQAFDELQRDLVQQVKLVEGNIAQARAEAASATVDSERKAAESRAASLEQVRDELELQRTKHAQEGRFALDEQSRIATLASLQSQFGELQQQLRDREQALDVAVEQGAITTEEAEKRKFAERAKALPQLDLLIQKQKELAATAAEKNAVEGARVEVQKTKGELSSLEQTARDAAKGGLAQLFSDIETGAKSGKAALLDMVGGFAKAMLDVLNKRLAEQLVNQFFGAAQGSGGGGGVGSFIQTAGSWIANLFHTGGIVGAGGGASRMVPAGLFAAAPRYHSGGIAGLSSGEVPAILKAGEEVLTERDPRHAKNFTRMVGGVAISVTVQGASGSEADQQGAGNDLAASLAQAVDQRLAVWSARESRPGGILAASGRGR